MNDENARHSLVGKLKPLFPQMARIVRMHQHMAVVQLSEVTHPLWTCSIEHQIGVHAANLESVGDGAVTADIFINTR